VDFDMQRGLLNHVHPQSHVELVRHARCGNEELMSVDWTAISTEIPGGGGDAEDSD
jgi:hypothetical protein